METTTENTEAHTHSDSDESPPKLSLTAKAIEKVHSFAKSSKEAEGKHLRVYVQGGGCSGFEYGFTFDDQRDDDEVIAVADIKVLLDPISLPYLKNATVDYVEDFRGSGFSVQNPNATGSCGCGHSFSV